MRKRILICCLFCVAAAAVFTASCKKNNQDYIYTLFTGGQWQLTSVMRYHVLSKALLYTDTLNTDCLQKQFFTFNPDQTCSYTNFDCLTQKSAGHWSISQDKLVLLADMTCQDTTAAQSSKPFVNSRIRNVGQYSLVLRTGQYNSYYPAGDTVVYTDYSFVRVKSQ
ncbi:MAG TPA: lipocalin family protein [Mucilaginibacter sp.]|nr:lipocalin family protein [Mucilaginibacter sp.]